MRKNYLKGLSIVLSSAMIIGTIAGCNVNTDLLKKDAKEEVVTDVLTQTVRPTNNASSDTEKIKEETVYVFTNANGSQKSILVNEKLSNPGSLKNIEDETTLTELGIGREDFDIMAQRATRNGPVGHYLPLDKERFKEVLELAV